MVLEIRPRLASYKASALTTLLSLWPNECSLGFLWFGWPHLLMSGAYSGQGSQGARGVIWGWGSELDWPCAR